MLFGNKKGLQLSNMIIGMLFTVAIVSGFFIWISDGITQYSATAPTDYNQSFERVKNISAALEDDLRDTQSTLNNTKGNDNFLDYFGFLINAGYSAGKTAVNSITSMGELVDVAIEQSALGAYGDLLKSLILLTIITIFIIGILLNFILKSGRE